MQNRFSVVKTTLFTIALTLVAGFTSCSSDEETTADFKDPRIKLKASKSTIVPFEDIKVSIDVDLDLLLQSYDSVTWQANGVAYSFWVFGNPWVDEDTERDVRLTDYRIGKHKAYALGYKNGMVISKDSIEYEVVVPKGDFLSLKWGENKKNKYLRYTSGFTPYKYLETNNGYSKSVGVSLELNHIVEYTKIEYATFEIMSWSVIGRSSKMKLATVPNINDFDWDANAHTVARYDMDYEFHHNYLVSLYGLPKFAYTGNNVTETTLKEEYAKRFTYDLNNYYPVEIWDTPTSVICLSRANNHAPGDGNQKGVTKVIAQPRK